jgi:hypothetical protein
MSTSGHFPRSSGVLWPNCDPAFCFFHTQPLLQREIGIRMALGTRRIDVFGLVMKEGAVLIATGTTVGFAAALAVIRALARVLANIACATETSASEPALRFGAPALLAFLALLCCCRWRRQPPSPGSRHCQW